MLFSLKQSAFIFRFVALIMDVTVLDYELILSFYLGVADHVSDAIF